MPHKRAKRSVREQSRSQQGDDRAPVKHALSSEAIPKGAARVLNAAKVQQEFRDKKRKISEDGSQAQSGAKSNKRRRKATDDVSKNGGVSTTTMKIQPGETLAHFNRRVEDSMRPLVNDAIKTSAAVARRAEKERELTTEAAKSSKAKRDAASHDTQQSSTPTNSKPPETPDDDPAQRASAAPARSKTHDGPKEFAVLSTSAPRRLNDIVQAPPVLKKLPRGAKARQQAPAGTQTSTSLRDSVLSMAQRVMLEEERERAIEAYRELKKRKTAG